MPEAEGGEAVPQPRATMRLQLPATMRLSLSTVAARQVIMLWGQGGEVSQHQLGERGVGACASQGAEVGGEM